MNRMSDKSLVSEALYVGLCGYIGTPTEVTVRREMVDVGELLNRYEQSDRIIMKSGSFREGYRFDSSDTDIMVWYTSHKVIADISQSTLYDLSKNFLILIEDTDTPPGFVRLQLLSTPQNKQALSSDYQVDDGMYISNSKWRQIMLAYLSRNKSCDNIRIHGPCANTVLESVELDSAFCFHSFFWSRLMCNWIKRCALYNWPSSNVFENIFENGCHFVPVGSKIFDNEDESEWRMSFSLAEQKLIYSMSHTQFLCYGLLKIFLKEVVNHDIEEPVLCSYFMKTTMFWLMQTGHNSWYPNELLDSFWQCLKYLLHCVHQEVMANFFVPQNNMFASKLVTSEGARTIYTLREQLNEYYKTGVFCLFLSPTLRSMILPYLSRIDFRIQPSVGHEISLAEIDECITTEISRMSFPCCKDPKNCDIFLTSLFSLSQLSFTDYELITVQSCILEALVRAAFLYLNTSSDSTNRTFYTTDRLIFNLLKLACKLGSVSILLYLAMYYYRVCKYREALRIIDVVKSKLTQPYLMHNCCTVNKDQYNGFVAGLSVSRRLMNALAESVCLYDGFDYIQELIFEQNVVIKNDLPCLFIPPLVLTDMLSVLCNYRLGNRSQCLQSLTALQTLLLDDDGMYVDVYSLDISWQILGICQHVVGDLHGAIQSYLECLREKSYHRMHKATMFRITLALYQLSKM